MEEGGLAGKGAAAEHCAGSSSGICIQAQNDFICHHSPCLPAHNVDGVAGVACAELLAPPRVAHAAGLDVGEGRDLAEHRRHMWRAQLAFKTFNPWAGLADSKTDKDGG